MACRGGGRACDVNIEEIWREYDGNMVGISIECAWHAVVAAGPVVAAGHVMGISREYRRNMAGI